MVKGLGIKLEKTVKFYTACEKIEQIEKLNTESELNFTQVEWKNNTPSRTQRRKDDIRDTKEFRNMIFTKGKPGRITYFNKWMIALNSCATYGV